MRHRDPVRVQSLPHAVRDIPVDHRHDEVHDAAVEPVDGILIVPGVPRLELPVPGDVGRAVEFPRGRRDGQVRFDEQGFGDHVLHQVGKAFPGPVPARNGRDRAVGSESRQRIRIVEVGRPGIADAVEVDAVQVVAFGQVANDALEVAFDLWQDGVEIVMRVAGYGTSVLAEVDPAAVRVDVGAVSVEEVIGSGRRCILTPQRQQAGAGVDFESLPVGYLDGVGERIEARIFPSHEFGPGLDGRGIECFGLAAHLEEDDVEVGVTGLAHDALDPLSHAVRSGVRPVVSSHPHPPQLARDLGNGLVIHAQRRPKRAAGRHEHQAADENEQHPFTPPHPISPSCFSSTIPNSCQRVQIEFPPLFYQLSGSRFLGSEQERVSVFGVRF